jgi:signal transduction histidine kinase
MLAADNTLDNSSALGTVDQSQASPASPSQPGATDSRQEIARLKQTIRSLRLQLHHAQRLASVGTMAAMVVHEFNNLLTPIVNYAQLAQKNPVMVEKALTSAIRNGFRATKICGAILGMTKRGDEIRQLFALKEMIDETLLMMARDPRRDDIDFICTVPDDLTVSAQRVELQQVILNLMINARAAVLAKPAPRKIEISGGVEGEVIYIRVVDNGVGISSQNLDKIFDVFFTTKNKNKNKNEIDPTAGGGGSGLGLAICRDILQSMGGNIGAESIEGTGTIFTIRLPRSASNDLPTTSNGDSASTVRRQKDACVEDRSSEAA